MKTYTKFISMLVLILMVVGTAYTQDDRRYTIGIVGYFDITTISAELANLGYIENENITYVLPLVGDWESLPEEELMGAYIQAFQDIASSPDIDIFLANTDTDAINLIPFLNNANTPIVFARSDDPVATGAVADLILPGGNITGNITNKPHERRLQILTEIKPDTDAIYYLYSVLTLEAEIVLQQVQAVAEELNIQVIPAPITDVPSALEALANMPEGIDWLFLTPYVPFDFNFFMALNATSLEHKAGIAGVIPDPSQTWVMGYGPDLAASDRQAAQTIDRILRGASPADLPVQISENGLMINLEAASAIDLEIPVDILRQADLIVRPGDFDEFGSYIGGN